MVDSTMMLMMMTTTTMMTMMTMMTMTVVMVMMISVMVTVNSTGFIELPFYCTICVHTCDDHTFFDLNI